MLLHELALDPSAAADESPALITPDDTWTRGELRAAVTELTGAAAAVARPGGRIAIVADSRPEVVALLLAIPAAGRIAVPINVRLTPEEVLDALDHSGAETLVATEPELARLRSVLPAAATVETTVGLDPGAGDISLETLSAAPALPTPTSAVPGSLDAPAWIIAASGTTGRARGAVVTARSLGAAVSTTAAARPLADDDVYLYPFPLYHVSAYNVLHALSRGRPVVLPLRFDAPTVCALAEAHRVTAMSLAPTMLRSLLDHRGTQPDPESVLADLRTVAYGAAPMPRALLVEAASSLGVGFAQGYGMTELSGNAVFLSPEHHRRGIEGDGRLLGAAGWPGPGVELQIVDDDGTELPSGEPGEVCVRGEQVCTGYWGDPESTTSAFRDGWLRTGDVGVLDDDGLLTIVDRAKDIIITGGENVASREVEDVIGGHPLVSRVAVVGVADDQWGEAVWAVVVARPDAEHDPVRLKAEIAARARRHLAAFKVPKQMVLAEDLPINAGGKVQKAELRRRLSGVHAGADQA